MKEGFNYFRIKTEWVSEAEDGALGKVKTEELVLASNYTEAEKVAYAIAEKGNRSQHSSIVIDITKTKINELLFNNVLASENSMTVGFICNYFEEGEDSGVGLYGVKVVYYETDEKTGKTKPSSETVYVPACSNTDAAHFVLAWLKGFEMRDYVIRDIKFDKAEAIFWPSDVQKDKVRQFENN